MISPRLSEVRKRLSETAPQSLIGWMIIEDYCEDYSDWSGQITYPDPTGANLAWQSPIKMIEHSAYEVAQADIAHLLSEYDRLQATVEKLKAALEGLKVDHRAWINGARADVIYERMETKFQALREIEGGK